MIKEFNKTNPLVRKAIANDVVEGNLENEFDIFTNLNVPKYIIAGDADVSVNRTYLKHVENSSKHHCEIIEFENCGHYPPLDAPEQFNRVVTSIAKSLFKP